MARLAACYFCGTALDEQLREYRLPDGDSVVLCDACRRKLAAVLDDGDRDAVGGALRTNLGTDDASDPGVGRAADSARDGADGADDDRDEAPPAGDADAAGVESGLLPLSGSDGDDWADGNIGAQEGRDGGRSHQDSGDDTAGSRLPDEQRGETDDVTASTDGADGATAGDDAADAGDRPTPDGADEPGSPEADGIGGGGEPVGSTGSAGQTASEQSVSAGTYDKVLRLLQNREFPVPREEIETVASSAYGLSERECAAAIDLAVERGLLAADGSDLRPPE